MAKDLWVACWVMTSLVRILTSATCCEALLVKQRESEASLSLLLAALAEEEALRECLLVVVADESFRESRALTELLRRPSQRQTLFVRPDGERVEIQWKTTLCRAYFILVSDPSPVLEWAGQAAAHWDYEGRYVILGLTLDDLTSLTETTNGRKTEHILGIIEVRRFKGHL
ncbi:uncharacterized protein LOC119593933 [Penaeus monodon]|uniref:uncharacterized protein LOC119593933 n=1 Tax=Penaeus monodon TaxID=6687 RepID=UPI0018A7B7DC|nr:uncharacterized protein LOC119593933 [Penaeus monodon]